MPEGGIGLGKNRGRDAWLSVDVVEDAGNWDVIDNVQHHIEAAAAALSKSKRLRKEPSAACIALSDDQNVRQLNSAYRLKDKATNVLSFPARPAPRNASGDARPLGDIVLAFETIMCEAQALGISPIHHVQHLVVHGLLHLMGFDHENEKDAAEMEGLETEILAGLGIADPYAEAGEFEQHTLRQSVQGS